MLAAGYSPIVLSDSTLSKVQMLSLSRSSAVARLRPTKLTWQGTGQHAPPTTPVILCMKYCCVKSGTYYAESGLSGIG